MHHLPLTTARWIQFLATAIVVLLLCQILRLTLSNFSNLPVRVFSIPLLELNLLYSENHGLNFGFFAERNLVKQLIFAAISFSVCTIIATVLLHSLRLKHAIMAGLIVGGGLSNIYERITVGFVFDYINTPFLGWDNPYSYNTADIFIAIPILWWVAFDR